MPQLLSLRSTAHKPQLLSPRATINSSKLKAATLRKAYLGSWPLTDSIWERDLPSFLTDKSGLLSLDFYTKNIVYTKHLLSFWESGILECAR